MKHSSLILDLLDQSLKSKGFASFIVSGGSSPVVIFQEMSQMNTDWSNVDISLVDDRVVDPTHKDSNEKLVNDLLMINNASNANFISICNDTKSLKELNRPYTVMLLGMGEDGHFASLFPSLIESNKEYFDLYAEPDIFFTEPMGSPCHKRVSMNLSMILESENIFLLVSSDKKNDVLKQAEFDKNLPLYYLLNQSRKEIKIIKS
ncbi:MAG: 6-phosphogluconolactonase [Gammaproteobacteria bacterium]